MYKNYLFDLDGTLLWLDETAFIEAYMKALSKKMIQLNLNHKEMLSRLWEGTSAMRENNGLKLNEDVFWSIFCPDKDKQPSLKESFEEFYINDFKALKSTAKYTDLSIRIIRELQSKNKKIYLLTNPIFPLVATKERLSWAGLSIDDFELVTTYENSYFAKPNLQYYQYIINQYQLNPKETMMIGNDVDEDMIASNLGLDTFLVTDYLNNKSHQDINHYRHGSLQNLFDYITEILTNDRD